VTLPVARSDSQIVTPLLSAEKRASDSPVEHEPASVG
jgi:hypothetical protein